MIQNGTDRHGTDLRDKHLGELIARLGADTSTLVRQEMALARAELSERMDAVRDEVTDALALGRAEASQKLDRAKADVTSEGKKAGASLGMFGAAGAATLLALGTLTAALVLLLDRFLPTDLAALLVGLGWVLVATALGLRGRDKVHEMRGLHPADYLPRQTIATVTDDLRKAGGAKQLVPEQTIETLKEDVEWAKTRGRSERT